MTSIDAVNAILRTIGRKPAEPVNKPAKPAKKAGKLGKLKLVELKKPTKKNERGTVTIRRSFRELLT